jgi:hypothetical protein
MPHGLTIALAAVAGALSALAASGLVELLRVLFDPSRRAKLHSRSAGEKIRAALG